MTYSQRAKDLVHAIWNHPTTNGNQWCEATRAEAYEVAQQFLEDERGESYQRRIERAAARYVESVYCPCESCAPDEPSAQADGDSGDMAVPV